MYNHQPKNYICPLCLTVSGTDNEGNFTKQSDVIYKDAEITAFISSHWWPKNPGNVIVLPNKHVENVYDIPDELLSKVYVFGKRVAVAFKTVYQCDGTSMRQHNEPAGNQDTWHFHLHVFPRYKRDNLYQLHGKKRDTSPEERKPYAERLRKYFNS